MKIDELEKRLLAVADASQAQPMKTYMKNNFDFLGVRTPDRNRIIAGLASGVIVAEAKLRSGSLITCERAMEEGRDIFAIPGSILDGQSDGCHHLIQEGAKCTMSGMDILSELTHLS